ncbi:MAG: hypothetical protein E4H01_07830 [Lysobacterales bacterium]|nr:MAG: hypothetical protein E4H01_07830 [Xanthomonadales bacterium]
MYNGSDGHQRYRCFGCGAGHDVIDFIAAIEGVDPVKAVEILTNRQMPDIGKIERKPPPPDQSSVWKPIVPAPDDAPDYDPARTFNPKRGDYVPYRPARLDSYYSADNRVLCHVVRLEFADGAKACLTITWCSGPGDVFAWAARRMEPPFPLMNLNGLASRPNDCVLIVSGEKCQSEATERMKNFVIVTWLGGDGAVAHVDVTPLRGRYITYWPDADSSSKRSMIEMHNRIERHGTG